MTTRDELIEYGKKHGWKVAAADSDAVLLHTATARRQIFVQFVDPDRIDYCQANTGRVYGGGRAVKRYLRENGDA